MSTNPHKVFNFKKHANLGGKKKEKSMGGMVSFFSLSRSRRCALE